MLLNIVSKFPGYFKLKIQNQSLFYGLLHVSSGRNEGWVDSITNSDCDIPRTGSRLKLVLILNCESEPLIWKQRSEDCLLNLTFVLCAYPLPNSLHLYGHILIFLSRRGSLQSVADGFIK